MLERDTVEALKERILKSFHDIKHFSPFLCKQVVYISMQSHDIHVIATTASYADINVHAVALYCVGNMLKG